jgi:hypothetical protein
MSAKDLKILFKTPINNWLVKENYTKDEVAELYSTMAAVFFEKNKQTAPIEDMLADTNTLYESLKTSAV